MIRRKLGLSLSYLAGDRGLVMTRSGWQADDLMLNLHTRQACGGHPYCDRNSFLFAGKGRAWFTINTWKGGHGPAIDRGHRSQGPKALDSGTPRGLRRSIFGYFSR